MLVLPVSTQMPFVRPAYPRKTTTGAMTGGSRLVTKPMPQRTAMERSASPQGHVAQIVDKHNLRSVSAMKTSANPLRRSISHYQPPGSTSPVGVAAGNQRIASRSVQAGSNLRGKPLRILCYGDSNTAGFHSNGMGFEPYGRTLSTALKALGENNYVKEIGLTGRTAAECVQGLNSNAIVDNCGKTGKGLARALAEDGPFDLVIIMLGTNDLGLGAVMRPSTILNHISTLHATCHRLKIPTIAMGPPTIDSPGPVRSNRQELAMLVAGWAKATPGVIAQWDCEQLCPKESRHLWEPDELHLSPTGSRTLGKRLAEEVAELRRRKGLAL